MALALVASGAGAGAATVALPIAAVGWTTVAELFAWAGITDDFEEAVTLALWCPRAVAQHFVDGSPHDVSGFLSKYQVKESAGARWANLGRDQFIPAGVGWGSAPRWTLTTHWR